MCTVCAPHSQETWSTPGVLSGPQLLWESFRGIRPGPPWTTIKLASGLVDGVCMPVWTVENLKKSSMQSQFALQDPGREMLI